jgi:hypothetical protein
MTDAHKKALAVVPSGIVPERMSPVVQMGMAILQDHPDPATLRELLAVQREWEAGEARKLFNVALHELKSALPRSIVRRHVVHDRVGKEMYRHTTLADIANAVGEPMQAHGFTFTWQPTSDGRTVSVRCQLRHVGGHCEETTMTAPADAGQNRNAVQAIGSTQTYLQRYTLCALLGLAAVDADDADKKPADPAHAVDQVANQKALAYLQRNGWPAKRCADLVGRPREEWTAADLAQLKAALRAERRPAPKAQQEDVDPQTGEIVPPDAGDAWEPDAKEQGR